MPFSLGSGKRSVNGQQVAGDLRQQGQQAAGELKEQGKQAAGQLKEQGRQAVDEASKQGQQAADEASQQGKQALDQGKQQVAKCALLCVSASLQCSAEGRPAGCPGAEQAAGRLVRHSHFLLSSSCSQLQQPGKQSQQTADLGGTQAPELAKQASAMHASVLRLWLLGC